LGLLLLLELFITYTKHYVQQLGHINLLRRDTYPPPISNRQIITDSPYYIKPRTPLSGKISGVSYPGSYPQVNNGGYAILTCIPSGGSPPYTYLWYMDGTSTGITTVTYTTGAYSNTSHTYYCVIKDSIGSIADTETDTVTWETIPLSGTISGVSYPGNYPCVVNNGYAILTCEPVGGTPPYTYQWYMDGVITGGTSQTYNTGTYMNTHHAYYCKITDSKGGTANTETDTVTWQAACPAI